VVNSLKPFFTFYGGKWRAAPHYPAPMYGTIVEPFAGSAGYSMRYPDRRVVLVEKDPAIAATWRYLLRVTPGEILALPDIAPGQPVDTLGVVEEAQLLIGWWCNKGSATPKRSPGSNMRRSLAGLTKGDPPSGWWGAAIRERIASQVERIRHWRLIEGSYEQAPLVMATWFVDPPYQRAGKHYRCSYVDYERLAYWCNLWPGQVMACENVGAEWLPFQPWRDIKASEAKHGGKVSREALWVRTGGDR
jgi:hypothetical protein